MASSPRKCFPLSVVHIFFYSALSCLLPFLNLHARDLGLTPWESSLSNLASAVLSGLGSLAFFTLARACGRSKVIVVICLVLSALGHTSLILIPRVVRIPRHPLMEFDCSAAIRLEKCENWSSCSEAAAVATSSNFTSFKLSDCRYVCIPEQSEVPYPLHVCFRSDSGNFCEVYDTTSSALNSTIDFQSRFPSWYFDDLHQVPASQFLNYDSENSPDFVDVCSYRPVWPLVVDHKNYDDIYCRPVPEGCQIKCKVLIDGEPGTSHCQEILGDPVLTFWTYLGVRSAADTFLLSAAVVLDTLVVLAINDFSGFYGRSRLWPALALAVFSPVVGVLVDYYSSFSSRPDYSPSVFIYDGLVLITCAVVIALRLQESGTRGQYVVNSPSKRRPFWSLELGVLFTLTLILGTLWGLLDTSLRPHFVDIGCSKLLVGATAGLPFLCSLPFLAVSKNLVRNIGKANLLVFALLFYAIRFAGLSFVTYPFWTFPFQAMETFTLVIAWISLVAYAHSLVSKSNHTTVHFILYFLHFSAGRALGTCAGALFEQLVGLPWTFRGLAVFSLVLGLLYLLIHHTCIKKRRRRRSRSSFRASTNGGALLPMAERRPNGDALHGKDLANRPMINYDQDDDK